jgi:CHAT domain-containing protein/tetratricopeptide (TPR) repeat protein
MNLKVQISRFVAMCMFISVAFTNAKAMPHSESSLSVFGPEMFAINITSEVSNINDELLRFLSAHDTENSKLLVNKLLQKIAIGNIDESILSSSYYYIGIYYLTVRNYNEAIRYLNLCASIKEKNKEVDQFYWKALYNLSVAYASIGEVKQFEYYSLKSLEVCKKIYREDDPNLMTSYFSFAVANIELKEYEKAINYSNITLSMANKNPNTSPVYFSMIYHNLGVCYSRLADHSKAKIYFEKAETISRNFHLPKDEIYINLLNGLAITCKSLGLNAEAESYYQKGVKLALSQNSAEAINLINSYCVFLEESHQATKGEKLLRDAVGRARKSKETDILTYIEVLGDYAGYLRENKIDIQKSISCYEEGFEFLKKNDAKLYLKNSIYKGYSRALLETGESEKALAVIQSLLFLQEEKKNVAENYANPATSEVKADIITLQIVMLKYEILQSIYKKSLDPKTLEAASKTAELIVFMLDKVRINISEEESRLILGDKYRDSYINAIHDFNLLYNKTSDRQFLEKAFEYSEKSKVAGLLTSTRELKAAQFHIPTDLGNFEKELQKEISLLDARISEESSAAKPDLALISKWKENLFKYSRKRDSLILIFENKYPDYYVIKYNTHNIALQDIPGIVGRNGSYVNYIVSNNVLYTFVVNRKNQQLLSCPIDSSFFNDIRRFRSLLSMPSSSESESLKFKEYQTVGNKLYKILMEPVRPYLISDQVVISPDNLLSYLPFETIPTAIDTGKNTRYKNISYLMKDLDISYTYSATFMAESEKKESVYGNKLIAFAPDYPEPIDIQSALFSRQGNMGILHDLPFARQEAAYVSDLTGGKLFENSDAKESTYKSESGKYDIIHLAMHTLVNDKDPMRSTLIFSHSKDSLEDGYLKTYEIYGIPLKAKMVVLSSCNTGTGLMSTGEGILSLARGFIYSGSQSVVMSMWEIEDKSGTEVVKLFYDNLKKGYTKSVALKKARTEFIEKADRLRSHPYFWSALVVYGNNSPLYHSRRTEFIIGIISLFVVAGIVYNYRKRKIS